MEIRELIEQQIRTTPVILYLKGSPAQQMCRFSAKVVQLLNDLRVSYAYVDVLSHPDIRSELPKVADWPTFPQLYVNGTLQGGHDIVVKMFNDGSLKELLANARAIALDNAEPIVTEVA